MSREKDTSKAFPKNIITIGKNEAECNSLNRFHPTQKPTDLMRYLILTYSNKGETVFNRPDWRGDFTKKHDELVEKYKTESRYESEDEYSSRIFFELHQFLLHQI